MKRSGRQSRELGTWYRFSDSGQRDKDESIHHRTERPTWYPTMSYHNLHYRHALDIVNPSTHLKPPLQTETVQSKKSRNTNRFYGQLSEQHLLFYWFSSFFTVFSEMDTGRKWNKKITNVVTLLYTCGILVSIFICLWYNLQKGLNIQYAHV